VDLDTVADELYALPPEDFTTARDAAAKAADDAELKTAVKALRKPTASAHAVNQIVRDDPDAIDALLDLGDELREAMTGKAGDVRALTEARREQISALLDKALPANIRDDVTATLEAATADPELGAAVRSGRLVKPLRYAGFGAMPDLSDAVATPLPDRRTPPRKPVKRATKTAPKKAASAKQTGPSEDDAQAAAKRERELNEMRQRVLDLSGEADDAQRRYDEAARAVVEARKLLDRAEEERTNAHKAAREAHAAAEKARRELGKLERS